jgi:hypothetical protein
MCYSKSHSDTCVNKYGDILFRLNLSILQSRVSLKTKLVAHPFLKLLVYMTLLCKSEAFQLLMFTVAQGLVPQPGVFLRQCCLQIH